MSEIADIFNIFNEIFLVFLVFTDKKKFFLFFSVMGKKNLTFFIDISR